MGQEQSSTAADLQMLRADRFAAARAAKAEGLPVVGLIGSAIPKELILAAGAFPFALAPRVEDFSRDSAPMEQDHETDVRSLFLQATSGEFSLCDAIVIASTSDAYRYLFQYLTEMARTGQGAPLPPIWLFDFLFGDGVAVQRYDGIVLRQLADKLSSLGGRPIDNAALEAAIRRTDLVRAELLRLPALRASGQLSGPDAMAAIGVGGLVLPETHQAILQEAIAFAEATPSATKPRLLIATAVPLYHDHLHRAVEMAGMDIVAEDDGWGSRASGPLIGHGGDLWARLLDYYRIHDASPRQTYAQRQAWLTQAMAGPVDGVLFYLPPDDQSFGWRYPTLAAAANALDKPSLLIRDESLTAEGRARIASALAQWTAPRRKARA